MNDDTRRLNRARFTDTASDYAAGRVAARAAQVQALWDLASPLPDDRVLDVACGPGALLATLAPRVRRAVGLDLTPAMLALARSAAPGAWLVGGAAERLPFDDGAFSLVACTWAMHHFAAPRQVLSEMARVCAPGGRVAVGDLIASEDDAVRARQNEIERLRDPAHVTLDSASGLAGLMGSVGVSVSAKTGGDEPRDFEEWCRMAKTPPDTTTRVRALLTETIAGDLAGMTPTVENGRLRFLHRWVMLVGTKA